MAMSHSKERGLLISVILGSLLISALLMIAVTSFAGSEVSIGLILCGLIISGANIFAVIRAHQLLPGKGMLDLKLKYAPIVLVLFGILMCLFPLLKISIF